MELRDGRRYSPKLENPFNYTLKIDSRNKRSPTCSPRQNADVGKTRQTHGESKQTNTEGAHSLKNQNDVGRRRSVVSTVSSETNDVYVKLLKKVKQKEWSSRTTGKRKRNTFHSVDLSLKGEHCLESNKKVKKKERSNKKMKFFSSEVSSVQSQTHRVFREEETFSKYESTNGKSYASIEKSECYVATSTPLQSRSTSRSSSEKIDFKFSSEKNRITTKSRYLSRDCSIKKRRVDSNSISNRRNINDEEFLDSLEDHIFHDTSYKKVMTYNKLNLDMVDNVRGDVCEVQDDQFHYLYKLNGSCLNDYSDLSEEEDEDDMSGLVVNHYRRSLFRQKRRDWYLNRRSLMSGTVKSNYFYRYLLLLKVFIFSTIHYFTKKVWSRYIIKKKYIMQQYFYSTFEKHKVKLVFLGLVEGVTSFFSRVTRTIFGFIFGNITKTFTFIGISCIGIAENLIFTNFKKPIQTGYNKLIEILLYCLHVTQRLLKYGFHSFLKRYKDFSSWSKGRTETIQVESTDEDDDGILLFTPCCCIGFLAIVFLAPLILLFLGFSSQVITNVVPDPNTLAISKSRTIFLGTSTNSIPAWHFLPPSAEYLSKDSVFNDKSPITLYLREGTVLNSELQKNIFKTLVSLGYHVIVPINLLNDEDVTIAWSWIKERASASSAYLWGDHLDSSTLTGYAKDFCTQLLPPDGVIIETEIRNPNYPHRSLEIWSCNCTYVENKGSGEGYHRYSHVKCPLSELDISQEQVYNHILSCIAAVNRDTI